MWEESTALFFKKSGKYTSKGIIFSGGVLGTVKLLLKFKKLLIIIIIIIYIFILLLY